MEYEKVSPSVEIPETLQDKWGGVFGCPITDENGKLIGFAVKMPQYTGEIVEAISLAGEKTNIVG